MDKKIILTRLSKLKDSNDIEREALERIFLLDFYCQEPAQSLEESIAKLTLCKYLLGQDPFPILTKKSKKPAGNPNIKLDIDTSKILYFKLRTSSINKTSKLLGIDRKTVRERISLSGFKEEHKEIYLDLYKQLYEDEFIKLINNHDGDK